MDPLSVSSPFITEGGVGMGMEPLSLSPPLSLEGPFLEQEELSSLQTPLPSSAVGFILLKDGSLFSFGLLPPVVEAAAAPGPESWVEIKMCPPLHILELPANKYPTCLMDYCAEKVKSHELHAKKHLNLILEEQNKLRRLNGNCDLLHLPPNLQIRYYCNQPECYFGLQLLDQSRAFNRMKYLRQHYLKLHAPKTFNCTVCSKAFSTLGLLGGHMKNCGNSFHCSSCNKKYSTLEALQTHCRRTDHSTDFSKFKDIIDNAKMEVSALRQADKDLKKRKEPLAKASLTSSQPLPVRVIIPRPKTIMCGPEGNPSHVIWTYDHGTDSPQMKSETCTQTEASNTNNYMSPIEQSSSSSSLTNNNKPGPSQSRRKRSAETQTGRAKNNKVSTGAQTLNITKRRRTSKKNVAEAETQCSTSLDPNKNKRTEEKSTSNSMSDDHDNDTGTSSLPMLMSLVGIDGESNSTSPIQMPLPLPQPLPLQLQQFFVTDNFNNTSSPLTPNLETLLGQQFDFDSSVYTSTEGIPMSTAEVCVGFDEPSSFMLGFEELLASRETQTDPTNDHDHDPSQENIFGLKGSAEQLLFSFHELSRETQTDPDLALIVDEPPELFFQFEELSRETQTDPDLAPIFDQEAEQAELLFHFEELSRETQTSDEFP